ncbi:putative malonyl-CoA decarboxylase [Brugia malayi]|uniref:Bm3845, isoform c n=1 Tax=Brugia malayi TaxID=6279 RepID=A0A1P6C008_BRUMA|nr:putative malonyl-CoA decarboxylase [Brugia malayi]CDP93526.1 Bm3845, isoform c [Brugia malayi]VIO88630.1 putative malonyl-CoA decarboxylase [Brugia malayi]
MFSRSFTPNLLFLIGQRNAITRKLFAVTFGPHYRVTAKGYQANSTTVRDIYSKLTSYSSSDQWRDAGEQLVEKYFASSMLYRRSILVELSQNFGVDHAILKRSIELYHKNEQAFMNVASASRPHYFRLFQSIGNMTGGVERICSMRADLLGMLCSSDLTRTDSAALRPVENCFRELLTLWFCQSNLRLQQLTIESPGDILDKVMKYEAVHPITGLIDMKRRLGPNRRCFVFMHEAMAREPLVVVYAAFMKKIAKNLEDIMNDADIFEDENVSDTAIFYSISSTQAGLRGIDLGNMLIKRVIAEISNTNPHIRVFATLSPMPYFRSWLLRSLKCAAPSVDVIDERLLEICEENEFFEGDIRIVELVRLFLLDHLNRVNASKYEKIFEIIMHLAVRYLLEAKHSATGRAFDPVENFHLRNGAEIYAVNWKADTTTKGMESSYGVMVNYLYRLDQVMKNSTQYIQKGEIAINSDALALL